jgi:hypothetical protein
MKKLAFVLFVAILALGMTGLASASPWVVKQHVYGNSWAGDVQIGEGQKAKIVFHPQGDVTQLNLDFGGAVSGFGAAAANLVKVKVVGQGQVYLGPADGALDAIALLKDGNVKVKVIGVGGIANFNAAAVTGAQEPPTAAPEPASMLLLGSGLVGMAAVGRRKFFKK